ncbi:MAG TPA: hypothetical protein VG942_13955 [Hyphomonadaceae bacterium]|nr:hypothetical protein [Hyphomonadaceae bacterium]
MALPYVMESVSDLWDHIAYVMEYAPNGFPQEFGWKPEEQMTFEIAFRQLHEGVDIAVPPAAMERRQSLHALLDRSMAEYTTGDRAAARNMLAEFETDLFTPDGKLRGDP